MNPSTRPIMQTPTMPTSQPILCQTLPLTITFGEGDNIDLICDVPGIKVSLIGDQLTLTLSTPDPVDGEHHYCYTIAAPKPDQDYTHYVAAFSGPARETMQIWAQENGTSRSPNFSLTSGEYSSYINVVVRSEPRSKGPQINSQTPSVPPPPRTRASTRHVKTRYQGGGDDR